MLLQQTRVTGNWEPWVLFMLETIEKTSMQTSNMVRGIKELMMECKIKIRNKLPKVYSQDLINNLFKHPYTKIDFLVSDLQVTRQTASKYLDQLVGIGLLYRVVIGKEHFFVNDKLFNLLYNVNEMYPFDNITSNVPPISLTNVPGVSLLNVPPVSLTNVPEK